MDDIESCKITLRNKKKEIVDYTIVSREDYDKVMKYKWHKSDKTYVSGTIKNKSIRLHRFIMESRGYNITNKLVDHINNNGLDNRFINLRISNKLLNGQNKRKRSNTSSKYYGVYKRTYSNLFVAKCTINKTTINLGTFSNEYDAAFCRDHYLATRDNFITSGFKLNFPNLYHTYIQTIPPTQRKRNKTSKYKGVFFNTERDIYMAIYKNKKILSSYNEMDCAKAYDKYIVNNNIKNKILNFPDNYPKYIIQKIFVKEQKDGYVVIDIKGLDCLIDNEIYETIKQYKLCLSGNYVNIMYTDFMLHRYVLNITNPLVFVDHINGNTLDNRKINLRLSNIKLNAQNRGKQTNTTSKYIGVSKDRNSWNVCVKKDNIKLLNKSVKNEQDAARLRDLYILKNLPNDHYKLNFEWTDNDKEEWLIKLQKYF